MAPHVMLHDSGAPAHSCAVIVSPAASPYFKVMVPVYAIRIVSWNG